MSRGENETAASAALVKAIAEGKHPLRRTFRVLFGLGASALAYAVWAAWATASLLLALDPMAIGSVALGLVGGSFFMAYATYALRLLPGVRLANAALDEMLTGRYDAAEALLRRAEVRQGWLGEVPAPAPIRRTVALHRATIALGRGDLAATIARAEEALAVPLGWLERGSRASLELRAHGLLALARALSDDRPGARADIARVRRLVDAGNLGPGVLAGEGVVLDPMARAAAAEVVLLAREGDTEALSRVFDSREAVILEQAPPRERALLRGIARTLSTKPTSPYRAKPTTTPERGDEPAVEDWVERVMPEIAELVPRPSRAIASVEPAPSTEGARKPPALRAPKPGASPRTRVMVLAVFVGVAAILYSSMGGSHARGLGSTAAGPEAGLPALMIFVIAWFTALTYARILRGRRTLAHAYRALAHGRWEEATGVLRSIRPSTQPMYQALASLSLARLAARDGRFDQALTEAEKGLATIASRRIAASASDVIAPELSTERAVAMAALGKTEEALALAESLPVGFAFRARSLHRIRLHVLVARGDIAGAAALASSAPSSLPIDTRTELCGDLARAIVSPESVGLVELQRVRVTARAGWGHAFLTRGAPALLAAFERADAATEPEAHRTRETEADATSDERDGAAEREHAAESEAEAAGDGVERGSRIGG